LADRLILVGRVLGAFGVRGELKIRSYTDDPVALGRYRELRKADGSSALTLAGCRQQKGAVIVARSAEVATRDEAAGLAGLDLYAPREAFAEPAEDEYYLADLIGLEAVDGEGEVVGRVKSVGNFGAGDLLEIAPPTGPSWWLVFSRETTPVVDLAAGRLVIRPPPGD
jgi:16S rRNA processing protein RimM